MSRAPPILCLAAMALCALVGCGEDPATPAAAPAATPATGEGAVIEAGPPRGADKTEALPAEPSPGQGEGALSEVARLVDAQLAGLRGKAAVDYARKALEKRLPKESAARRAILLPALQTGSPTERWVAALAVPTLDALDDELLRALLQQSQAETPWLQSAALDALAQSRAFEDAAVERMWRVVESAQPTLRSTLLQSLGRAQKDIRRKPDMLRALEAQNAEVRSAAAFALSQLDLNPATEPWPHEDVRTALSAALQDEDAQVRWWALLAFPRMGPHARPAVEPISNALDDPEARIQSAASSALLALGPGIADVLAPRVLRATRANIDGLALVLRRLGDDASLQALRGGLAHEDPYIGVRCAIALQARKAQDLDAPALFAKALESPDAAVVLLALEGLGKAGPAAAPHLDRIEALRAHPDEAVRRAASVLGDLINPRSGGR